MADTTSHDTVGASTLVAPYFLPSSPPPPGVEQPGNISPRSTSTPIDSPKAESSPPRSPTRSRDSSLDRAARELDARLAEYSVDFSQFPSAHGPGEQLNGLPDDDDEVERLSAPGGPEDFTANIERYLMGEEDSMDHGALDSEYDDDEKPDEPQPADPAHSEVPKIDRQSDSQLHQSRVEDEAELGEDSEFGPPVDMSTPSHLLRRTSGLAKDVTHLEDIFEENPDDDSVNEQSSRATSPSVRKFKSPVDKKEERANEDLRRQIAELREAVQDRDERIEKNRKRVLEAASAGEQIKHLQGELQRKTTLIEEFSGQRSDESSILREQVHLLQRQNEPSVSASEFTALQKQIAALQTDLQNHHPSADLDAERLETIAVLRQQLAMTQEQLKKRDATLDETLAKLKEVTAAKELQLHEKNADIDDLRSQIETQALHIEKLETDVSRANREYQALEAEMALLETKNRPLEEKNSTLEADLTRAQSQVTAQENALKAMAADLPLESGGSTYTEILELIKDLGPPTVTRTPPPKTKDRGNEELVQIREELAKLRVEATETSSAKKTLEIQLSHSQEQATESQLLIKSIETENTRLTNRVEDLKSTLDQTIHNLAALRTEHTEALQTIQHLRVERTRPQSQKQQPSPPLTPLTTRKATTHASPSALETQIANLKTAHTTAISTLRASHADSNRKLRALLSAAEERESALQSQLENLQQQQQETQTQTEQGYPTPAAEEIESLHAEIKRLHSVIAAKDETAAAIDARIARSVEKREKEWERRVELLLKERERMSRALLWSWGEKEVGDENKENIADEDGRRRQGYRYKYVKK